MPANKLKLTNKKQKRTANRFEDLKTAAAGCLLCNSKNTIKHPQIIDSSSIPIFVIDQNHIVIEWNKACALLTGVKSSDIIGTSKQWLPFYGEPRPVLADLIIDSASEDEIVYHYENKCQKSSLIDNGYEVEGFFPHLGSKGKWLFFTAAPVKDNSGNIIGAVETLQDITLRKNAIEKLRHLTISLRNRIKELDCLYKISSSENEPNIGIDDFLYELLEIIPTSRQYPKEIAVHIEYNNKTYETENYNFSGKTVSVPIVISKEQVGNIEICYMDKNSMRNNDFFIADDKKLLQAVANETGKFIERRLTENRLRATNERLINTQIALERKNAAMREILNQIESEKSSYQKRLQVNINKAIIPIINFLKENLSDSQTEYIKLLEFNLNDIISPFIDHIQTTYTNLTTREIQICDMIRNGFSSKQISSALNISILTVHKHRQVIRKKLGLTNRQANLESFLNTDQLTSKSRR